MGAGEDRQLPGATVSRERFGVTPDGQTVERFTLTGTTGMTARVITLGAILQSFEVPDAAGAFANVTLGCPSIDEYLAQRAYLGAIIGRYANRIADGRFELEGVIHQLSTNEPPNTLHGGSEGFDRRLWATVGIKEGTAAAVTLELRSPDGDQGFPGALRMQVRYLIVDNELRISFRARSDKPTIVNPTSHIYWNLAGEGAGTIDNHVLWLNATHYTPIDPKLIPTGTIDPVRDTPLDFTTPDTIGRRIDTNHEQLHHGEGYDHNFVLDTHNDEPGLPQPAASLFDPNSRRRLDVLTTSPGLQFYSGNRLDGTIPGTNGAFHQRRSALALEPQFFPDAPNQPHFPTLVLRPGDELKATSIYRFALQERSPQARPQRSLM